jgi:hypothetical protein
MQESEQKSLPVGDPYYLGVKGYLIEVIHGTAVMAGLALLWSLEAVRNVFFGLLDRWNIRSRPPRKVSAFPPGQPRRRKAA